MKYVMPHEPVTLELQLLDSLIVAHVRRRGVRSTAQIAIALAVPAIGESLLVRHLKNLERDGVLQRVDGGWQVTARKTVLAAHV